MIKDGREYRSAVLFRAVDDEKDSYIVEGYATTFNDPYEMRDGWKEQIDRNALDGADMKDVIFQLNHQGAVLARQRNNTLSISCDDNGLYIRADLGGSAAGRELHEAIKNGLMDRMSWGFTVSEDGWDIDDKNKIATIKHVRKVYDVSAVSIPANDGTEIKARSYLDGVIESRQQELLLRRKHDMDERQRLAMQLLITTKG